MLNGGSSHVEKYEGMIEGDKSVMREGGKQVFAGEGGFVHLLLLMLCIIIINENL